MISLFLGQHKNFNSLRILYVIVIFILKCSGLYHFVLNFICFIKFIFSTQTLIYQNTKSKNKNYNDYIKNKFLSFKLGLDKMHASFELGIFLSQKKLVCYCDKFKKGTRRLHKSIRVDKEYISIKYGQWNKCCTTDSSGKIAVKCPSTSCNATRINTEIQSEPTGSPNIQHDNINIFFSKIKKVKVIIRGDRQTGKSGKINNNILYASLLHRLEGGKFKSEHIPTPQIQAAHVPWTYKTTDEMVKLEIWDVVDNAMLPEFPDELESTSTSSAAATASAQRCLPADASSVDVYKGANAVIFMVDPTQKWTLDYAKQHIPEVHESVDVLVLFIKKDLYNHWTLTNEQISEFMSKQPKNVRHLEVSLKDCFGIKELHTFLSVPFLRMK
ncbi:Rab-like GTP-binding protein, partial [Reticulomyxa filosa]